MSDKWLVIGISGVTCGGKTTLASRLHKIFNTHKIISQDDYFLDVSDERHTWIEELNHIHFDILSSLDMEQMHSNILNILKNQQKHSKPIKTPLELPVRDLETIARQNVEDAKINLLIIEGFCIFNYPPIEKLCDVKYYFTLERDECLRRRSMRVYEPPDCPGYFEVCVWPEYQKQLKEVQEDLRDVTFFNEFSREPIQTVLKDIANYVL